MSAQKLSAEESGYIDKAIKSLQLKEKETIIIDEPIHYSVVERLKMYIHEYIAGN